MIGIRRRRRRRGVKRKAALRSAGYAGRLIGEGLIQNAGVALVGAGALKLRSKLLPSRTAAMNSYLPLAQFKKRGRPKGAKDKQPRQLRMSDRDIDKNINRAESLSRSYSNVARGSKNFSQRRREEALATRYEIENQPIDVALRRTGKAVNTIDTARRTAQSVGLIRRTRTRGGNPIRRAAAGIRLGRMLLGKAVR